MARVNRQLAFERARRVEVRLRARAELLKPKGEHPVATATPLGLCDECSAIVYSRDGLVISGGHLLHDACARRRP